MVLVTVKFLLITQEWNRDTFYYCKYYCLSLFDSLWQNIIGLQFIKTGVSFSQLRRLESPRSQCQKIFSVQQEPIPGSRDDCLCRIFKDRRMREISGVYFIRVITFIPENSTLMNLSLPKVPIQNPLHWGLVSTHEYGVKTFNLHQLLIFKIF